MNIVRFGSSFSLALALAASAGLADPSQRSAAPGVAIEDFGIHCNVETVGTQEAPDTSSGEINLLSEVPEFAFRQQEVPARFGISFGVVVVTDSDIEGVQFRIWKPGANQPEFWYGYLVAGEPMIHSFTFERQDELVVGPWSIEAYADETELYSVEFQVLPGSELPGVTSDCSTIS
jgi:hypothetical protein